MKNTRKNAKGILSQCGAFCDPDISAPMWSMQVCPLLFTSDTDWPCARMPYVISASYLACRKVSTRVCVTISLSLSSVPLSTEMDTMIETGLARETL